MLSVPTRYCLAFGVVLGTFYLVGQGDAQEPKGTSTAPAKASSASPAPATHDLPPDLGPSLGDFGNRPPRGRIGAQPSAPKEALVVLKSGPDHVRLVLRLKDHPATNLSTTIRELLRQEGEISASAGTAAKGGPVLRVAIAPEVMTNSLIVSGPPDAVEEVRMLAEKFDQPPPQVQFEMEMGEVAAGDIKHGESLKTEAGEKPNTYYVLERPKSMKTIARARVLTLDNQPANVQMGQRVPTISSFPQYGGYGKSTSSSPAPTVTHQNVGLILGVTPRISVKEGKVVLQVAAEDSQLGPEDEGIPIMVADNKVIRSPRIETISIQTCVTIPDGKTIMLGSRRPHGQDRQGTGDRPHAAYLRPEDAKKTGP